MDTPSMGRGEVGGEEPPAGAKLALEILRSAPELQLVPIENGDADGVVGGDVDDLAVADDPCAVGAAFVEQPVAAGGSAVADLAVAACHGHAVVVAILEKRDVVPAGAAAIVVRRR